ncbi:MAG: response regulator transcription factor [Robiginitomaculum sp.]|nr:response regulator transcription factor [Robiginitomaculum sp.]MDQ7078575.1 response regulator transcription factor [Robiginitomaculum sp.]
MESYKTVSRNGGQPHRGDMLGDPVRLAIADKNPLIIRGLRSLFTEDRRFETVVAATDGELFLDCVERMQFDIGIIGWDMPFCNAQGVLEALADREDAPSIIIYTGNPGDGIAEQAMALGAAGFCSKTQPPEHLMDMIMSVAGGQMVFPLSRGRRLDPLASLTAREREILQALCDGKTNARLAKAFGVSPNTIKFHLRNLYEKLGVQNRAAAVAMLLSR